MALEVEGAVVEVEGLRQAALRDVLQKAVYDTAGLVGRPLLTPAQRDSCLAACCHGASPELRRTLLQQAEQRFVEFAKVGAPPVIGLCEFLEWAHARDLQVMTTTRGSLEAAKNLLAESSLPSSLPVPLAFPETLPEAVRALAADHGFRLQEVMLISADADGVASLTGSGAVTVLLATESIGGATVTAPHYTALLPYCPEALPSLEDAPTLWFAGTDVFSNFSPHPIRVEGLDWPTSEHYYQSRKFVGQPDLQELIRAQPSPAAAAAIGRDPRNTITSGWDDRKRTAMLTALVAKFTQNPASRVTLLETGDVMLVEYSELDPYWGCNREGSGRNYLGRALMAVRRELKERPSNFVWDGVSVLDTTLLLARAWAVSA